MLNIRIMFLFAVSIALTGCGGGGGGSSAMTNQATSGGGYGSTGDSSSSSTSTAATSTTSSSSSSTDTSSTSSDDSSQDDDSASTSSGDTNTTDSSDDTDTTSSTQINGHVIDGYIRDATVFLDIDGDLLAGQDEPTTTSAEDGSFSLTVSDTDAASFTIVSLGGTDVATSRALGDAMTLIASIPATQTQLVVTPLSTLSFYAGEQAGTLEETLGFSDAKPAKSTDHIALAEEADPTGKSLTLYAAQATLIAHTLSKAIPGVEPTAVFQAMSAVVVSNSSSLPSSFGDTTFVKSTLEKMLENDSSLSWTGDLQSDLLAVLTSTLQKMYVESDLKALNTIASFGLSTLADDMKAIVDGTASETTASDYLTDVLSKIDQIYEGFELSDKESGYRTIEYAVSNNGSSNYIVDNVNPSSEEFVVYARIGDTLNFQAASNSVFNFHPFKFSSVQDATSSSNDLGQNEGASYSSTVSTLVINSNTPKTIFPRCSVHSGMYSKGKIVIVDDYSDFTSNTDANGALRVIGTVAKGPFKGASGHTYDVYLTTDEALAVDSGYHEHSFLEYPGLDFYMPNNSKSHGKETSNASTLFKPKSHYKASTSSASGY